jgi:hypothetical protein
MSRAADPLRRRAFKLKPDPADYTPGYVGNIRVSRELACCGASLQESICKWTCTFTKRRQEKSTNGIERKKLFGVD